MARLDPLASSSSSSPTRGDASGRESSTLTHPTTTSSSSSSTSTSTSTSTTSSTPSSTTTSSSTSTPSTPTTSPNTTTPSLGSALSDINAILRQLDIGECKNGYPKECDQHCGCPRYTIDTEWIKTNVPDYYKQYEEQNLDYLNPNLTWTGCAPTRVKCSDEEKMRTDWIYKVANGWITWDIPDKRTLPELKCDQKTGQWSNWKNGKEEGDFYTCIQA